MPSEAVSRLGFFFSNSFMSTRPFLGEPQGEAESDLSIGGRFELSQANRLEFECMSR